MIDLFSMWLCGLLCGGRRAFHPHSLGGCEVNAPLMPGYRFVSALRLFGLVLVLYLSSLLIWKFTSCRIRFDDAVVENTAFNSQLAQEVIADISGSLSTFVDCS